MWVLSLGQEEHTGGGHGNLLQYSYLKNPMDRGAWWATVHKDAKSQTQLKQLSMHACMHTYVPSLLNFPPPLHPPALFMVIFFYYFACSLLNIFL